MEKEPVKDLILNSNIIDDIREAYTFMLLSKGYALEEINGLLI